MLVHVITRSVEPGRCAAGGALLTLVNLDELYLRGFIPEGQIGMVKVGQGQVYLDSFPKQPLLAKVTRVDPKASFTPENTFPKTELLRCLANLPSKIPGLAKLNARRWSNRTRAAARALYVTFCTGVSKTMTQTRRSDGNSASKPLRSQSAI